MVTTCLYCLHACIARIYIRITVMLLNCCLKSACYQCDEYSQPSSTTPQTVQPSRFGGNCPASRADLRRDAVCPAFKETAKYSDVSPTKCRKYAIPDLTCTSWHCTDSPDHAITKYRTPTERASTLYNPRNLVTSIALHARLVESSGFPRRVYLSYIHSAIRTHEY